MDQKNKPVERIKKMLDVKDTKKNFNTWYYVVEYKGEDYDLKMFDFQKGEKETRKQLVCLIEKGPDGKTIVKQDMAPLIAERYKVGQIYKFKVRKNDKPLAPYVAVTPENFRFYIDNPKNKHYFDHSEMTGRILSIEDVKVFVQEVDQRKDEIEDIDDFVEPDALRQLAQSVDIRPAVVKWASRVVKTNVDFADTCELLEAKSADWLREAVRVVREKMPQWVAKAGKTQHQVEVLRGLRSLGLQILEQSNLATGASADAQALRDEISACLNKADDFNSALNKINDKSFGQYVQSAINSLERTGYIYEPGHRLSVIASALAVDHSLIRQWMPAFIGALSMRSESEWKREPLRSALIDLLSAFVDLVAPEADRVIDITLGNNKVVVSGVVKVLTMLLLLSTDNDDDVNRREILARMCRYSSLYGTNADASKMLNDKAFGFLLTRTPANLPFSWVDLKGSADVLSIKTNSTPRLGGPEETMRYDGRNAAVEVIGGDVIIRKTGVAGRLRDVLPAGITGWHNFHVELPGKNFSFDIKGDTDDIDALRRMWREMEDNLFDPKASAAAAAPAKIKTRPDVGDEVVIRINGRAGYDTKGNPKFTAVIVSETMEGEGVISPIDIVHYNVKNAQVEDFCDRDGKPFLLRAKVAKVMPNGDFVFDMQDLVGKFISDTVQEGDEVMCRMTIKTGGGDNLLISERGYSLKVTQDDDFGELQNGDIVKVEVIRVYSNGNVDGVFVDWGDEYRRMPDNDCLNILLNDYADDVYEGQDDEDDEEDDDYAQQTKGEIAQSEILELMNIIDRQSTLSAKRSQSFNLLALARIIALVMNNPQKAEEYHDRMTFIHLMQQYAVNQWIDTDEFEQHYQSSKGLLDGYPDMQDQVMRLFCISRIDKEDSMGELAELAVSRRGSLTAEVACLVMAYNTLKRYEMEDERRSIRNKINELLKVETRDVSHLDFLGEEGPTLEFKTSLVFPPDNNQRPNKDKQCLKLLTVVCGMMNTKGGRLLVGVNDSGLAEGLASDFKELAGRSIYDEQKMRDVMLNFFGSMLRMHMPKTATGYVDMNFEDHNGRTIFAVDVRSSKEVMDVDKVCYRRVGSSTYAMDEHERKQVEDLKKSQN